MEWNSPFFINFVDFSDSIHRESLWEIMANYWILNKLIRMIKLFYDNFQCTEEHEGKYSERFRIKSGVSQDRVMSGVLFLLVIVWVMRQVAIGRMGINCGRLQTLEDLDFADDVAILSSSELNLQGKTIVLTSISPQTGLRINSKKTKVVKIKMDTKPEY